MDVVADDPETVEYRVALVGPSGPQLMVAVKPDGYRLPRVKIPRWSRPAEEINDALRRDWQLNTLVLTILYAGGEKSACAIAEVFRSAEGSVPRNLALRDIDHLSDSDLNESERVSIRNVIAGDGSIAGPFSHRGWFTEVQAWIRESIQGRRGEFSNDFRQYNASNRFALLRLGTTDGERYWFKATGAPNMHECALTVELSKLFPEYLPKLIAVHEDWNAWLTADAGRPLGSSYTLELLTAAVEALADLQIRSIEYIPLLVAAGCMDRSLKAVQQHLPEMFAFLENAMRNQTSTKAKPLEPARLRDIRAVLERTCAAMEELQIPSCLVNGDINLDNILDDGTRLSFTDWAEGGIGNPFLTLQQLIQHVIREGEHFDWVPRLCDTYKTVWRTRLTSAQIDSALILMPLLTMVDYLHGRGDWLDSSRRDDAGFQSFARTMSRCMDRAAAELSAAGVL